MGFGFPPIDLMGVCHTPLPQNHPAIAQHYPERRLLYRGLSGSCRYRAEIIITVRHSRPL
ncbi:MAG TPA: hypothetical protein V6D43_02355 [Candidatus Sericytochromatia bacterium]